jgi:hypothetical protein
MRVAFAALAAALLASPALAADEPVATASQTPAPAAISTADQIDAYLKSSPALDAKADGAVDGVVARDDRKVHGEVSVGIGTGGYRSVYVRSEVPVGDNGRLSLAFEDTKYGRNAPYRFYGGPYGGHPGALGVVDRQRCDLEGMTPARPMDMAGGPHGRCVGRIPAW